MPKEPVKTEKATDAPAEQPVKASEDPKFPYDVLKDNCVKLFGVTSSTFIGATIGMEGKEYSINHIKNIIDGWLKKPINMKEEK